MKTMSHYEILQLSQFYNIYSAMQKITDTESFGCLYIAET